jgi:hypothetical protein
MTTVLTNSIQEVENLETYSLIWLDTSVNISKENIKIQQQLRTIINYFLIFEDEQQCLQYIHSQSKDDRIILIINEKFSQQILPKLIHLRQINSIYIYCNENKAYEQWSQHFRKVNNPSFCKHPFAYIQCFFPRGRNRSSGERGPHAG